jgi:hypothetical protein
MSRFPWYQETNILAPNGTKFGGKKQVRETFHVFANGLGNPYFAPSPPSAESGESQLKSELEGLS